MSHNIAVLHVHIHRHFYKNIYPTLIWDILSTKWEHFLFFSFSFDANYLLTCFEEIERKENC